MRLVSLPRILVWLVSFICLLSIFSLSPDFNVYEDDFIEYWSAGRVLLGGGNPFEASELDGFQKNYREEVLMMWNPPWTLPFVLPFAVLPFELARLAWLLLLVLAMLVCVDWLWVTLGGQWEHRWFSRSSIVWYFPSFFALTIGQISPFILAGVVGFLWAERKGRPIMAGLFAFPIAFKPQLTYAFWLVLALSGWRSRKPGALISAAAALLFFSVMACLWRPSIFSDYLLAASSSQTGPAVWRTPTWSEVLFNSFPDFGFWLRYSSLIPGVILVLWFWLRRRREFNWTRDLNWVLLFSCLTTPFAWSFDMVVLMPVIILLLIWFRADPARNWIYFLGLIGVQLCAFVRQSLGVEEIYTVWMPAALAVVYWFAFRANAGLSDFTASGGEKNRTRG